jgi:hypothetical protein
MKLLAQFLRIKGINKIVEKRSGFLSEEKKKTDYLGMGLGMGASLGMLMDNIRFGIAIGTALGVAFGTAMNQRNKKE